MGKMIVSETDLQMISGWLQAIQKQIQLHNEIQLLIATQKDEITHEDFLQYRHRIYE